MMTKETLLAALAVFAFATFAQQPPNGGRGGMRGDRSRSGLHHEPSFHRPWIGSGTYDKNLQRGHGDGGVGRAVDRAYDRSHREEDRARRIRDAEQNKLQQQMDVRANKRQIEANRAAAESAARAREREQSAEIQRRAAEQERTRLARQDEAARRHAAAMRSLKPCRAYNDDGSPCRRKANPGLEVCHVHVGYSGELQPLPGKVPSPKPIAAPVAAPQPTVVTQTVVVAATRPVEKTAAVLDVPAAPAASDVAPVQSDRLLIALAFALVALVALVAVGGFIMVAMRRRGE